jgi:hypothetical protein
VNVSPNSTSSIMRVMTEGNTCRRDESECCSASTVLSRQRQNRKTIRAQKIKMSSPNTYLYPGSQSRQRVQELGLSVSRIPHRNMVRL